MKTALESADLVLFVVDVRDGLTPLDEDRRAEPPEAGSSLPILVVVNKSRGPRSSSGTSMRFSQDGRGRGTVHRSAPRTAAG